MAKRFLRSIVSDFQTLAASADIVPVDLPVNPLSHVVLTLAFTKNVAAQVTSLGNLIVLMLQSITDLSIRHRGETIIQGSLMDMAVLNAGGWGGMSERLPLNDSKMKVSSPSTTPVIVRGLSPARDVRNLCRQRNAVV